jgi:hypothetical protein
MKLVSSKIGKNKSIFLTRNQFIQATFKKNEVNMKKHSIRYSLLALLLAAGMVLASVQLVAANGEDDDPSEGYFCVQSEDMHPFGERLASRYEVDYEILQGWFCDGFGWGQIMLALKTSAITGDDFEGLLERRGSGEGWGQIWQDLKLIGRPEDAGPPNDEDGNGRPDFAGPPEWAGEGRPDFAGPPEWAGEGRPDFAGPPDWAGEGRPDFAGPPDWAGEGRPEDAGPPGLSPVPGGPPPGIPAGRP